MLADRYLVERELGQGGMATVYLAEDIKYRRKVALKVLLPDLAASLGADRFFREVEIAAVLQHPHIVGVLESGQAGDVLYYTMPFVDGETLRAVLDREVQLDLQHALAITHDVAAALDYAHRQGVVHRDIKPENILLSDGHAMVADFGIAKAVTAAGGDRLTRTGLLVGTPHYMSPEQAGNSDRLDGRSDIYSLGCMLYELLAGQPPFGGPTAQSIMARHAVDPVPSLRTVRGTVPLAVERAIAKAMAKVPSDRFPTASKFSAAIAEAAHEPLTERRRFGRRAWQVAAAALVGVSLLAGLKEVSRRRSSAPPTDAAGIRMLAVSPFGNLTGDSTQIFLAQGITNQLIAGLTQIGNLKVITLYDEPDALDRLRGRGIDVDVVLNGSLQRAGQVVRITAQLNSARTGEALWARSFTGELQNILSLQDSVMRAVTDTLRVALSSEDRTRLNAAKRQINPQAYEAYVRGTYFLGKVSEANFRKAIGLFQQAIDFEPFYADAYAQLAQAYLELAYYTIEPPDNVIPKARSAALKAIQIDSSNGPAYVVLARYHLFTWDFVAAERNFRHAIDLDPRNYYTHFGLGIFLTFMNRPRESIEHARMAVELDPLNLLNLAAAARPFYMARRYPEAIAQAKRALEIDSTFSRAHYWIAMANEQMGNHPKAIQEFEQTIRLAGPMPVYAAALAHAYVVAGRTGEGRQMLATLEKRALTSYISPVDLAMIYAALGDKKKAFDLLEVGYTRHDVVLITMHADPRFDTLRSDPRWTELTRRIGFPKN